MSDKRDARLPPPPTPVGPSFDTPSHGRLAGPAPHSRHDLSYRLPPIKEHGSHHGPGSISKKSQNTGNLPSINDILNHVNEHRSTLPMPEPPGNQLRPIESSNTGDVHGLRTVPMSESSGHQLHGTESSTTSDVRRVGTIPTSGPSGYQLLTKESQTTSDAEIAGRPPPGPTNTKQAQSLPRIDRATGQQHPDQRADVTAQVNHPHLREIQPSSGSAPPPNTPLSQTIILPKSRRGRTKNPKTGNAGPSVLNRWKGPVPPTPMSREYPLKPKNKSRPIAMATARSGRERSPESDKEQ